MRKAERLTHVQAAHVLAMLTAGAVGSSPAEMLQHFDSQICALIGMLDGKILDAEQKRDAALLYEGLNDLYIELAAGIEQGADHEKD